MGRLRCVLLLYLAAGCVAADRPQKPRSKDAQPPAENTGGSAGTRGEDLKDADAADSSGPPCVPESDATFCTRLAKTCGTLTGTDNCGAARNVVSCGTCVAPQTCGGASIANICGCTPETDAAFCSRL